MKLPKMLLLAALLSVPTQTVGAKPTAARWWPQVERHESRRDDDDKYVVKAIQYLLRARGQKMTVDGTYGLQTERAVSNFQRRNGLVPKGKLNNATWEALVIPCKMGATGDGVRALQSLLRGADYDVPVDGRFGSATRAAVIKFQKVSGLAADAFVGKQTWCLLVDGGVGEQEGD